MHVKAWALFLKAWKMVGTGDQILFASVLNYIYFPVQGIILLVPKT